MHRNLNIWLAVVAMLLVVTTSATATDDWQDGVVILKVNADLYRNILSSEPVVELGIDNIDAFLAEIGVTAITHRFPTAQAPIGKGVDLRRIYKVDYSAGIPVPEVCDKLMNLAGVEYACPAVIHYVTLDHNDPQRQNQYGLDLIEANAAHDISTGSEEIVIAITDTGIMPTHEDLVGNLWVNPGEDLNGNGVIDDNERNGQDDDNNGRVDDFHGWNVAGNDGNITDTFGHGTNTSGIASAVTNNETGVASIGYSCRIMVVKVGPGPQIPAGYPGIVFAVDMGADIINCSWGGAQSTQEGIDAAAYAYEHDVMIVAAAGNNNTSRIFYPAGFDHVLVVAATDQADRKAGFSNFGDWVDVCAPGVAVVSTTRDGGYGPLDGTSASAPFVAGAAGILKARYPDFGIDILSDFIKYSADDIHEQNGALADQLGGGRLNAEHMLLIPEQPLIVYRGASLYSDQNRNGKLDPGERASIVATVTNRGHAPDTLIVSLSTQDPDIEIIVGEMSYPNLGTGESYTNTDSPFTFFVAEGCVPHTTRFRITVDAQPGDFHHTSDLVMLIGQPDILVVDDDDGSNYESFMHSSIEGIHLGYLNWSVNQLFDPPLDTMVAHRLVIWQTGDSWPPLTSDQRFLMADYINMGGNILLTGRNIGDDNENFNWLRRYFGASHAFDSVNAVTVNAPRYRASRPLAPNVIMALEGPGGSGDGRMSPSAMDVVNGADTLAVYRSETRITGVAGTYREDENSYGRVAYLGFTFEGVSDNSTPRRAVLEQLISWFVPELNVQPQTPVTPLLYSLDQAYPNPFNGLMTVRYSIGTVNPFRLVVRDIMGREVALLAGGVAETGQQSAVWDATAFASGQYLIQLEVAGNALATQKLVLVK